DVGVPPSGAFDGLSAALGAAAVGNQVTAAGLEWVVHGPALRFDRACSVCLTGAVGSATLDGRPVRPGVVLTVPAGAVLDTGPVTGPGMRGYLSVAGGFDLPAVLGSRATFLLGGFGGMDGRTLRAGDELPLGRAENVGAPLDVVPLLPELTGDWTLRVLAGPHGAPDYLTEEGVAEFFEASWLVDHRADRTGVRLIGPAPQWSRTDGGEAGLHPSNLHDSAYPVGGIMLSGDTPAIVGPDGPSLGGFVVPAVVISADLWKLGQLRPGDRVRLRAVSPEVADESATRRRRELADPHAAAATRSCPGPAPRREASEPDVLARRVASGSAPAFRIRRSGDTHLLVEAGPPELDLSVRMWIHLLADALRAAGPRGVTEIV